MWLVVQSCPTLCNPMDCSPPGSSVHGDSPSNNTGMGCHTFLQGIIPTRGVNPGLLHCIGFPGGSDGKKHLPTMQETQVRSLGWEDPLEKEMATHSSTLAWKIPWTEEPGGLQSMGLKRVVPTLQVYSSTI